MMNLTGNPVWLIPSDKTLCRTEKLERKTPLLRLALIDLDSVYSLILKLNLNLTGLEV